MSAGRPDSMTRELPDDEPILFATSIPKLVIMYTATFGLYQILWAYKNFKWIGKHNYAKVFPKIGAVFLPITLYSMCKNISTIGAENGMTRNLAAVSLGISFFLLGLLYRIDNAAMLLGYLSLVPLVTVQKYINEINEKQRPAVDINDKYSKTNIIWFFISPFLWFLVLTGLFLPG